MRCSISRKGSVALALLAAALYALSSPISKVLLGGVGPTMLAGLLYLGAGLLMLALLAVGGARGVRGSGSLRKQDLRYVVGMVLLDIAAPILLLAGLVSVPAANVSLLNNLEIVATALIALAVFHEPITPRLWAGIGAIVSSCLLLSLGEEGALSFSPGSLLVVAACLCWGVENNCTNSISTRDVRQVVAVKGIFSGMGSVVIAYLVEEHLPAMPVVLGALALGSVAYGLSILCYVLAQRGIGAARTSAYYAVAPFVGVAISWALFGVQLTASFVVALALMLLGIWLALPEEEA